jgi:CheY-like chemotaxis protein
MLETVLKTEGYTVLLAADGEEGMTLYRRQPADVVVVDMFMPRKDGLQTINELRVEFPDAAIIAVSADSGVDRRSALSRARDAGAHVTIRKPIEPWILLRAVEGLIAGRRALGKTG